MSRRALKAIVVYDPHPHVSIFRELAGYKTSYAEEYTDEDNTEYLRSLDPKDWKTNDHYAVLNLKSQRYRASDDDIRKRYRQLVLKHHPDKRRARGENIKDISHDYFACITQGTYCKYLSPFITFYSDFMVFPVEAFEILGNPSKRYSYDSVDPFISDYEPTTEEMKEDFYGCLNRYFMGKARWSKHQPTPFIGHSQSPIEQVHRFYDFWDSYETTKDYSFLDEEDREKGEDRESRRYIERCNRAERQKRRNEEQRRVHRVVDEARSLDPRLRAAERAARDAKEARKRVRLEAIQRRRAEEEARVQAEAAAAEAARTAEAERQRQEAEAQRREREAAKAQAKREKKRLRTLVTGRYKHFIGPTVAEQPGLSEVDAKLQTLKDIDYLCHVLSVTQLLEFNDKLERSGDEAKSFSVWKEEVARVRKESEAPGIVTANGTVAKAAEAASASVANSKWTFEMTQVLIKAVNLFPAGTQKRWEVIAAYVNQHVEGSDVTGKDALKQTKTITQDYDAMKHETNQKAFDSFATNTKQSDATRSVTITDQIEAEVERPWSVAEQRALEAALRANPVRAGEASGVRWQRIADEVGTRTRRECLQRYKQLAEQVRLKKAAMAAAGVQSKK